MEVFVREAVARAGFERQEAVAAGGAGEAGFLEVCFHFHFRFRFHFTEGKLWLIVRGFG